MARFLFPEDDDIYRVSAPGSPLYSTLNDPLTIYVDAGGTTLADITHVDHTPIYNSAIMLNGTATIPQFYGPDGVTTLWASQPGGEIFPLYALAGPRLDALEASVSAITNTSRTYTLQLGAITAGNPFSVDHNLGIAFPQVSLWQITAPGVSGNRIADSQYLVHAFNPNRVQITTASNYSAGSVQITVVG